MKSYEEMYGKPEEDYFYGPADYQPILEAIGEIVLKVDDENWSGDSRVLYKQGDEYGYLQFGWGSCSGCDALQGCNSPEEVVELANELARSVLWATREKTLEYFRFHDWEGDYSWSSDKQKEFVAAAIALLEAAE